MTEPGGYDAGSAYMEIVPSFRGILEKIKAEARGWGDTAGTSFSDAFSSKVKERTSNTPLGPGRGQAVRNGEQAGGAFGDAFRTRVEASTRNLRAIRIDADTKPAEAKLQLIRFQLEALSRQDIGVDLSSKDAVERIAALESELRTLTGPEHDVRVRIDASAAAAELAKVRGEIAALDSPIGDVDTKTASATKSMSGLWTAALILGASAIPVLAAGAAGVGALGAAGATLLLGVKGASAEMKAGTELGRRYSGVLNVIKSDVAGLEHTAAQGLFPGFDRSAANLHQLMPALNNEARSLSGYLGDAGAHVVHGMAGGFITLEPLVTKIVADLDRGAAAFDKYANGGGLQKFGEWAQQNLPSIEHDIGQLLMLVARLLAAGADSGLSILNALGAVAEAINKIPMPVLEALLPLVTGTLLAWKGYTIVAGILKGVNVALDAYIVRTNTAAVATARLGAAELATGAEGEIGGLGAGAKSAARGGKTASAGEFLALGNGVAVPLVLAGLATQIVGQLIHKQSQTQPAGTGPGPSGEDYTKLGTYLQAQTYKDLGGAIGGFLSGGHSTSTYGSGVQKAIEQNRAKEQQKNAPAAGPMIFGKSAGAVTTSQDVAAFSDASALSKTAAAHQAAAEAALNQSAAEAQNTLQMQYAGDKAGLLQQALTKLNTSTLDTAEAQTQFYQQLNTTAATFKSNKGAIEGHSAAALADQSALESLARSTQATALAESKAGRDGVKVLNDRKAAVEETFRKQGTLTAAVQKWIDTLFKVPKNLPATVAHLDNKAADKRLQTYLASLDKISRTENTTVNVKTGTAITRMGQLVTYYNALHDKTITVTTETRRGAGSGTDALGSRAAFGGSFAYGGGMWPGYEPGLDSIPIQTPRGPGMVSKGEAILVPEAVMGLGGPRGIYDINRSFAPRVNGHTAAYGFGNGGVTGFASGGAQTAAQRRVLANSQASLRLTIDTKGIHELTASIAGSRSSIAAAAARLVAELAQADARGLTSASFVKRIQRENSQILAEASRRDAVGARLTAANAKLAAAQKLFNDERATVASSYSSSFDITRLGQNGSGAASADSILRDADVTAAQALTYRAQLEKLKPRIGTQLYQQLQEAGPGQGASNVAALSTATPQQLARIAADYKSVANTGLAAGTSLGNLLYGPGVQAAAGLIAGLKSQEKSIQNEMTRIANLISKTIRKELRMHSPSLDAYDAMTNYGAGMVGGLADQHAPVEAMAKSLANKVSVKPAVPGLPLGYTPTGLGSALGGGPLTMHVRIGDTELREITLATVTDEMTGLTREFELGPQP
ncbi:MAG: hypothetical protein ACR2KJ_11225 [Jatrophihabitans sp.]